MVERCLRCVPHDEDTGGFFVATLRKIEKPSSVSTTVQLLNVHSTLNFHFRIFLLLLSCTFV